MSNIIEVAKEDEVDLTEHDMNLHIMPIIPKHSRSWYLSWPKNKPSDIKCPTCHVQAIIGGPSS